MNAQLVATGRGPARYCFARAILLAVRVRAGERQALDGLIDETPDHRDRSRVRPAPGSVETFGGETKIGPMSFLVGDDAVGGFFVLNGAADVNRCAITPRSILRGVRFTRLSVEPLGDLGDGFLSL